jgi:hypothetical protein
VTKQWDLQIEEEEELYERHAEAPETNRLSRTVCISKSTFFFFFLLASSSSQTIAATVAESRTRQFVVSCVDWHIRGACMWCCLRCLGRYVQARVYRDSYDKT